MAYWCGYNENMARRHRRRSNAVPNETILLIVVGCLLVSSVFANSSISSGTAVALIVAIGLLLGCLVLGYALYIDWKRQQALRLLDMAAVDDMPGLMFERWVGAQLRTRGYKVSLTPINDYGVDIVAKKDGFKTAVQVKCYRRVLDQKPIREAVAGMLHYKCSRSMVVTNSYFTQAAKTLAQSNHCELIDRDKLAGWLAETQK